MLGNYISMSPNYMGERAGDQFYVSVCRIHVLNGVAKNYENTLIFRGKLTFNATGNNC